MKCIVINRYGVKLAVKIPKSRSVYHILGVGEFPIMYEPRTCDYTESHRRCEKWIRKHDTANTCSIVEVEAC